MRSVEKKSINCAHHQPMDPRVRRTRKLLEDALRELIREKGWASLSVQDVTERATVNRATFYAHYADKQTLLESVIKSDFETFMMRRFAHWPAFAPEGVREVATAIIEFTGGFLGSFPVTSKELGSVLALALQEEIQAMFQGWIKESGAPSVPGRKDNTLAMVLSWSIFGAAYRWSQGDRKSRPEALAKSLVAILLPDERLP